MHSSVKQGLFLTFEGGEGSGKTTLIDTIARFLSEEGYIVLKTREPGGTRLGEKIRDILLDHKHPICPYAELSLFLASRAQHISQVIKPALKEKQIVLCDRYNDSTIAYQGHARGLGVEQVRSACEFMTQGLVPHLTIYLDLDPEIGLKRAGSVRAKDRIESEQVDFHQKIREAYLTIHHADMDRFCLIDASMSPQDVYAHAIKLVNRLLLFHV